MKNILSKTLAEKRTQNGIKSYSFPTRLLYTISIFAFLTLGVGQMWGDNGDFYNMYIAYSFEGAGGAIDGADNNTGVTVDAGTLTSGSLTLTGVYLKCWDDWGSSNYKSSGGQLCYTNKGGSTQYISCTRSGKSGNNYEYQNSNPGVTLASYNQASGSFEFHCWGQTWGWGDRYFPKSSGHYVLKYKIAPPAVSGFTITPSGEGYVSGTGTESDPYIMKHDAGNLVLTMSGSKAHTDANSSAKYYNGSSWSATATKTITYASGSTTKQSITLKMKYNNSTASLDGAESSIKVYYQRESTNTVSASASPAVGGSVTPSSSTTTGQKSGIAISASNNTGYTFSGWSIVSGSGSFVSSTTTASNRFKPTSNTSLRATFTAKNYTVTLNKNDGDSNGSVQTTYNSSSTSSFTGASRAGYSCDGYFTDPSTGSKVINADGTLVSGTVSGWLSSGNWVKDAASITLYAHWTEDITNYTVTYAVKSDQTSLGTLSCAKTVGGAAVSSGSKVASGTGVTFTASPITGYEVDAWYSNPACTTPIAGAGYANTYATSVTADLGVYVKFKKKIYTITYSPSSAPTGCTYTTKPTTGTYGNTVTMVITPSTGYTVSVSARDASSNVVTISNPSANTYTFTQPASAVTVTVSTSQIMSSLSTSCSYDAGNPSYSAPTKSVSSIGIATTSTVTAASASTGYTFAGWTLTNCTRTDGGDATATTITVRSNGDGAAATVVANYNEVLTSRWHLVGANVASKVTYPDGWNVSNISMMQKATGHSTESVVYANVTVSNADGTYEFKVVDDNGASDDIWYGYSTGGTYLTWTGTSTKNVYSGDGNSNNLKFTPTVAGTYVFKVDYSGTYPAVTITYPVSYTLTYGIGTVKGNNGSISTSPTTASGSKVISDTEITLTGPAAKTGYTWKGWYTNAAGTEGKIDDVSRAITVTMNADKTLYACYTINNHAITHSASTHGSYTIQVGSAAAVSTNTTSDYGKTIKLAATPATGYHFGSWSAYKTETPATTVTVTSNQFTMPDYAVTVGATFTPNTYRVQFHRNGGAGVVVYQDFTYDAAQNLTANSYTRTGYTFAGWATSTSGEVVYANGANVSNLTATNEGTYHLYAKWTANPYTVVLDKQTSAEGYGGNAGTVANQTVTFDATPATVSGTMPTAAQGYGFMGFYSEAGGNGRRFIDPSGNWVTSAGDTISGGKWVKPAGITLYAYYKKAEITALTFDNAVVAPSETVGVTPTVAPTPTGTNSICWKLLYSNGNLYSPQPTFSPASPAGISTKVTFTAPGTSGTYLVAAVLRTGNDCNGGTKLDSVAYPFQVAGDHNVTIQYKCGDEVIAPSNIVNGRPLVWSDDITAPDIFGYTFARWDAGDGVTIKNGDSDPVTTSTDVTIKIKAVYDGRLTAVYTQKQMIYFKNTLGWSSVYVNFYTGDYWNVANGSGNKGVTNRNKAMTQIDDTDIWYYDYGTAGITPTRYVSFTEDEQEAGGQGYENFYKADGGENVVYPARRADDLADKAGAIGFYAATPMFVPLAGQTPVKKNSNKANYFNSGYWTKYTSGTGYTLEVYYDSDSSEKIKDIAFNSADELMPLAAVANLEASTTYRFQIKRAGDVYYGNAGTMTYADHGQSVAWEMSNEATRRNDANTADVFAKCKITTTAAGDYTFNLSYSGDNSNPVQYRLRMEVDYPIADGDYRVIYTDATRDSGTRYKPSAIVTKANNSKDTVSFFIRPKSSPVMKIQKSSVNPSSGAITWTDHITITSEITDARCPKDSVYKICLTMNESGDISVENVEGYTGSFYIRTDAANSRWDNYRAADHLMTYSEYSETYSDYTHYFMAYVANGKNVKFVVANDYSPCISDTLVQSTFRGGDSYHVDGSGNIQADANVRFMWNRSNNAVYRAYLAKAQSDGSKFLVLRANSSTDLMDENGNALTGVSEGTPGNNHGGGLNCMQFTDNQNWIYEANVKVKPGAFVKLYAHFHDKNFYYRGNDNSSFDGEKIGESPNAIQLITGEGTAVKVRVVYDFKTDRLLAAWMPEGEINDTKAINADVMFVREGQGDISQLTFTKSGAITAIKTAYGVMRFNKWTLNNKDKSTHGVLGSPASIYERSLFWISFPFKVKLSEVFGFGTYGVDWAIQRYDGAERAEKGFWAESKGFWKWMDRNTEYLEPNQGYLLAIDLDLLGESASVWNNNVENIELYFPSYGTMPSITSANVEHTLPSHACTIDRSKDGLPDTGNASTSYNRTVFDSHWNVMSVPTYVNTSSVSFTNEAWITAGDGKHGPNFLYTWNPDDNTLTPTAGVGYHYHAMHAYMVQYHGNVTWSASSGSPYSIVARRTYADQPEKLNLCLEIRQNEKMIDRTYVVLSNDEEVSENFQFGEDMTKEFNARKANICTYVEGMTVAGNTMPMSEQTTIVPVGAYIKSAGDYTFAIPEGTEGIGVTLVDNETGVRTSLSALDYTINLPAGTHDNRFFLEISPIKNTPTDIENEEIVNRKSSNRKLLIDGILYIVKDGKMYDARGTRVE